MHLCPAGIQTNGTHTELVSISPELMQISYISRATNCRSLGLSLRSQPIQPNVVNVQCTSGTIAVNPNNQLRDTLQAHTKRCKVDIPLLPFCLRYVARITVIDHLGAVV